MRILFTANPMFGHVNPVLVLALAARAAGHDIVVATGPDLVPHVERHGVAAWPAGPTHQKAGGGPDADWLAYFVASAHGRAAELIPRATRWRPDLVVAEETELAGLVAAAVPGTRYAVHGLGTMPPPGIWAAYTAALHQLHNQWDLAFDGEVLRSATYLEVCPPTLRPAGERIWPNAIPLRPAVPQPLPDERLPHAVDALPYADTVHLTLGTVYHSKQAVLRTALHALRNLPVNVVVAAGPDIDPTTFGPRAAHVLIEPYVPYPLLLPKCRLVISQGGFGVMLAGLTHGVPQLAIPQGADQFRNAEACQNAGAGLVLHPEHLTGTAIAEAATRLLNEPTFTVTARTVQADIHTMPDAATVLTTLTAAP